jgi:translation elongation factor EF-Tu-like GTPase
MTQGNDNRHARIVLPPQRLCPQQRDVQAEVTFLPTDEGGYRGPVQSVYFRRPIRYDGLDWDALFEFALFDWAYPGQTVTTFLAFLSPQCHVGRLTVGKEFLVREGQRTRGTGVVTAILNLEANARGRPCDDPRLPVQA